MNRIDPVPEWQPLPESEATRAKIDTSRFPGTLLTPPKTLLIQRTMEADVCLAAPYLSARGNDFWNRIGCAEGLRHEPCLLRQRFRPSRRIQKFSLFKACKILLGRFAARFILRSLGVWLGFGLKQYVYDRYVNEFQQ